MHRLDAYEETEAHVVDRVLAINEMQIGITDAPLLDHESWGELIVHSLVAGENGYGVHESLRAWSPRAATLLERIEDVGVTTTPSALPVTGVVHYDLHVGNLLVDDGTLVAVIDREGASLGDPRFDLVCFALHLEGRGWSPLAAPAWTMLEATLAPEVLRAYVAHIVLRLIDWQIRHQPSDVTKSAQRRRTTARPLHLIRSDGQHFDRHHAPLATRLIVLFGSPRLVSRDIGRAFCAIAATPRTIVPGRHRG